MNLIYSVFLCLVFKARSCRLQCVKETLDDTEFSINVTTHTKAESGECISIPYEFTFPTNKVGVQYRTSWFRGDPQNKVSGRLVSKIEPKMKDALIINGLPHGEYEYGFQLEWECNQTYIFPKRVRISVSALSRRPRVLASHMTEGRYDTLSCSADILCYRRPRFRWEWTKADGQSMVLHGNGPMHRDFNRHHLTNYLLLNPTADDHNTNISCVADYGYNAVKTTVTLTVEFPPKILNDSQCTVGGKLVVCVCMSQGNPLPSITWPLAFLTDFSVTSSSSIQTVKSTITMPAADYHNTTCISSNKVGRAEIKIPSQNNTVNHLSDWRQMFGVALPWIIAGASFSLNLVFLTVLIIRGKRTQKKVHEEMDTYASLNKADVEKVYSVISPQPI